MGVYKHHFHMVDTQGHMCTMSWERVCVFQAGVLPSELLVPRNVLYL